MSIFIFALVFLAGGWALKSVVSDRLARPKPEAPAATLESMIVTAVQRGGVMINPVPIVDIEARPSDPNAPPARRTVAIHAILREASDTTLVTFCFRRNGVRNYRLSRILATYEPGTEIGLDLPDYIKSMTASQPPSQAPSQPESQAAAAPAAAQLTAGETAAEESPGALPSAEPSSAQPFIEP